MANGNGGGPPQAYQSPEITELGRVQDLSLEATGTVCTYEIGAGVSVCCNDTSQKSISVTTQANCDWSATASDDWINLVNASGTGSGSCTFTLSPYSGTTDRVGSVTIEGQQRFITQRGCAVADFTPGRGAEGWIYDFDATASTPSPSGTITNYAWKFGDGATGSGVTVSHTYGYQPTNPATLMVELTITDSNGCTGVVEKPVVVVRPRPCPVSMCPV